MDSLPKTLVILTPAFPSEEDNTWMPSQAGFVRTLKTEYPQLAIVILAFHFPLKVGKEYIWEGNRVLAFRGGMKGSLWSLMRWQRVWKELRELRKNHDILGLFSFFCSESAFVGHYFARRYKLRHFIWVLGQDARKDNTQVRRIKPAENELVAISDFLVREFSSSHGIRPKQVIPIGVDPANFTAELPRAIDIMGAGSLSAIKQYDVFIWVVREICRQVPGIKAMICGHGTEHEALQQQIDEYGLQENIMLTGGKTQPELWQLMQQSKILLHPSSYEGFGMVCAEALAAGAHVISFCRPLDADIEHWHIVENKEEMAEKALELLMSEYTEHSRVIPHKIADTARAIMHLYRYDEATY
jgi:glycosyltransferase involved in cell wall biosynthesis